MFDFFKRRAEPAERVLPRHIAIIMDGNGRWAQRRGLPRTAGHSAGAANFRNITRYCSKIGIKYLTVYAFSTENWKRPAEEVNAIMNLFRDYLSEALEKFRSDNIKVRFIGDRSPLSAELRALMNESEEVMKDATGMVLNIAINYGGRQEITAAAVSLARDAAQGLISPEDITEQMIASKLDTAGQPDPDLIIRPSGEQRLSNFLLWQSAYAEFWSSDVLWPDFRPEHLEQAIADYGKRHRRYGGVTEKKQTV
jgi:undecaprenyl diphosphate synthase